MADESSSSAGQRFSEDLRRIREDRNVSLDEIHNETRIARTLIESFEEGALYDHPTYNRVYLRSFVKAYAEAVEISRELALGGLDDALEGTYDRELADRYLASPSGSSLSPSIEEDEEASSDEAVEESEDGSQSGNEPERDLSSVSAPTAGGPEGRGGIVGPPRAVGESADDESPSSFEQPSDDSEKEQSPASEEAEENPDEEPKAAETTASSLTPNQEAEHQEQESGEEDVSAGGPSWIEEDTDGGDPPPEPESPASPSGESSEVGAVGGTGIVGGPKEIGSDDSPADPNAGADSSSSASPKSPPPSNRSNTSTANRRIYVTGIGIAVVLLVLVGLGIAYFTTGGTSNSPAESSSPAIADTTESAANQDTTVVEEPTRPPANVTLGETIHLTVLATENVSRILIERDDDLRRPYWIENGEAGVFPFQEEVILENELSDIRLFIEGYPYPVEPADTVGGLELTRGQIESFVDTLRGESATLSVVPDTIPVGEPSTQPQ